jgi:hypothetical protein
MMKVYKSFLAFLAASLICNGCMKERTEKKPFLDKPASTVSYEPINDLASRVAELGEKLFPGGGVVYLGENYKSQKMYASVDVLREKNVNKALDITIYVGNNPLIESRIRKLLSRNQYRPAIQELKKSPLQKTRFFNYGIDSMYSYEQISSTLLQDDLGAWIRFEPKNKEKVDKGYRGVLTDLENALKKADKNIKKNVRDNMSSIMR